MKTIDEKRCSRCLIVKSKSEFHKHCGRSDGLNNRCKECDRLLAIAYRLRNPDRVRENSRKSYLRHSDRIKAYQKKYNAENKIYISSRKKFVFNARRIKLETFVSQTYDFMTRRCSFNSGINSYYGMDVCSIDEFMSWCLENKPLRILHRKWVESGFERKIVPSIDRVDNSKGYVLSNMQWLTSSDNTKKRSADRERIIYELNGVCCKTHKICTRCNVAKTRGEFSRDKKFLDGLYYCCKLCRAKIYKETRQNANDSTS